MTLDETATRVVVFLSEDDRSGHGGLQETLIERAREDGMAGATLWRGIEGYGTSGSIRSARNPDANIGLPLMLEVIDTAERIDEFLPVVHELAPGCLVTRESIRITRAGGDRPLALDDPSPRSQHS